MPLKLKETKISAKHDRLKNPNWREADRLVIYKSDRGVELGSTEKQLQLRAGLESSTSGFQVQRPNNSATLPPVHFHISDHVSVMNSGFVLLLGFMM